MSDWWRQCQFCIIIHISLFILFSLNSSTIVLHNLNNRINNDNKDREKTPTTSSLKWCVSKYVRNPRIRCNGKHNDCRCYYFCTVRLRNFLTSLLKDQMRTRWRSVDDKWRSGGDQLRIRISAEDQEEIRKRSVEDQEIISGSVKDQWRINRISGQRISE